MHKAIQVVDKTGKPAGVADSPFEAIEKDQIRLLARMVITNSKGEFLLQKRADDMRMYPGRWDTAAAGHVDAGETPEETAYRELAEEIGLEDIKLEKVAEYYDSLYIKQYDMTFKSYSFVFKAVFNGDIKNLKLAEDEVTEVAWFKRNEIEDLIKNKSDVCTDGLIKIFGDRLA